MNSILEPRVKNFKIKPLENTLELSWNEDENARFCKTNYKINLTSEHDPKIHYFRKIKGVSHTIKNQLESCTFYDVVIEAENDFEESSPISKRIRTR